MKHHLHSLPYRLCRTQIAEGRYKLAEARNTFAVYTFISAGAKNMIAVANFKVAVQTFILSGCRKYFTV
jgi:hypothetical protein